MRKLITGTLVTAALLVGAGWLFRGELAVAIMARAAASNLAQDTLASLPDGLHVLFCGAGSPLPDPQRSGPCVAVVAGSTLLVVDAGTNGVRNLQRMGVRTGSIRAVLLTHFHSDHIDGLGEMAMQRWVGDAHDTPLPVIGPTGVESIVAGFNQAYALDFTYRTAHHGEAIAPPSGAGSHAQSFALPAAGELTEVWAHEGLEVHAFAVDHGPVSPAVGYRFDYGGRSLVISGDTAYATEITAITRGADLLVHEALAPQLVARLTEAATAAGREGLAQITRDIVNYHTSPVDAARIARDANVRALALYHVVPPLLLPGAETAFLEGVADIWDETLTVARDGTLISLPAGTREIALEQRL